MSPIDQMRKSADDNGWLKDFFAKPDDYLAKIFLEQMNALWSSVGDHPFFDTSHFPWVKNLEANWRTIRDELESLLSRRLNLINLQDLSKEYDDLTNDSLWKTFVLFGFGTRNERSCRLCPETTRLVDQVPGIHSAGFSVLGPRKHVPPHRGLYKGLLRCHMGLIVPEPKSACRLRVDREIRNWEEGKMLIFDDSFQHEVWNDTDKDRVVLLLDFVRPLPSPISLLNDLAVERIASWPLFLEATENYRRWESSLPDLS